MVSISQSFTSLHKGGPRQPGPSCIGGIVDIDLHYFGATKLEFWWKRRLTGPLNVFCIVLRSRVLAAHLFDIVEAFGVSSDTVELWQGRDSAMRCLVAIAESERSDFG